MDFITAKTPKFIKWLYPNYLWSFNSKSKELFLTFDDGPTPEITPWVLKILSDYNAKASFFCIGKNIDAHPQIFHEIINQGHTVANHTYNHINGWKTSLEDFLTEVEACTQSINEEAGKTYLKSMTKYFRPPYGKIKTSQAKELRKLRFNIVMWDVLAFDWVTSVSEISCFNKVKNNAKSGSIIVLHDSEKAFRNMKYALPKILEHFSLLGYKFKALP